MTTFLFDGFDTAPVTILLAHGAGAPMDSPSMTATAKALAAAGFQVARFEFHYMAARRYGHRKPPPRAETVNPEYVKAILDLRAKGVTGNLIIGGKSMGGRVASMVADEMYAKGEIAGLVCLGYPFHPPAKPEQLRTKHLIDLKTPTLIFQGTRDEFGTKDEVAAYGLSPAIEVVWLEDGDHDLKPRKAISGFSRADHLKTVAETTKAWAERPHRSSS
ncbi:alpha/beta family hydrolase [Mesorhizobium sp. B2-8-3]|uniref:alpha/beta hydrolase family protein n=1 Tax=Mesorhizobium sp. B2-8-3 TaxID=2589905 RepID=UPI001129A519|nr:alpha/beta family hydrolase [Mesorhizobium sp. B2-8-3]TPJ31898.1 alpha/beta fold hydrolase [Mesorhizobium sp. B2-8-3]